MGTNYYLRKIKEINNNQEVEIHLGKRSGGWEFCFDANMGKYYDPNRKSITELYNTGNYILVNEYGEEMDIYDFWNMVEDWNSSNHRTASTPDYNYCKQEDMFWEAKGYNVHNNEFVSDGLRFVTYTDFC